jgi:hypothetical protein
MPTPVDIYTLTDDLLPVPIVGASVAVLDPANNLALVGLVETDSGGKAGFLLPGAADGKSYEVRFYKLGVVFPGPRRVLVLEPPSVEGNAFTLRGMVDSGGVATDPRLCRCRGRFVGFNNKPLPHKMFRINQVSETGFEVPKVVDNNMVMSSSLELHTDANGYVEIDLLRGSQLYCTFAGEEDTVWNFTVPDRASANLVELIHPHIVGIEWSENPVEVEAGQGISVPLTATFSDYTTYSEGLDKWLLLMSSDEAVVKVRYASGSAVIMGVAPGMASIVPICPSEELPNRLPPSSISALPLVVTVTAPP